MILDWTAERYGEYCKTLPDKDLKKIVNDKRFRMYLFGHEQMRADLWMTRESIFSVTPYEMAERIADTIVKSLASLNVEQQTLEEMSLVHRVKCHYTITDGTANVGGDTLAFARRFHKVRSIEIQEEAFQCLKHNVHELQKNRADEYNMNIDCIKGSLMQNLNKETGHVLYLDPPWGGPGYKTLDQQLIVLELDGVEVASVAEQAFEKNPDLLSVWIKAPTNFQSQHLKDFANTRPSMFGCRSYPMCGYNFLRGGMVTFFLWAVYRTGGQTPDQ